LDSQVFGRIAGHEAAMEARFIDQRKVNSNQIHSYLRKLRKLDKGKKTSEVRSEVQTIASQFASVVRTEEGLKEGLKILGALRRGGIALDDNGLIFALETENLMDMAEIILRACLLRKESRGPHLFFAHFEDLSPLPLQDLGWRKYIVIQNQMGKMVLRKKTPVKLDSMSRGTR
jgi:succinate dehydrogenase / fumarate reductase flavoprotein subunit